MPKLGERTAKRIEIVCLKCGKSFIRTEGHAKGVKFCSNSCKFSYLMSKKDQRGEKNASWRGGRTEKVCTQCGETFKDYHRKNGRERLFCSRKCSGDAKTKERVKTNCLKCGKEMFVRGVTIKAGWGKFCSRSCATLHREFWKEQTGEKHHLWKGGITPENNAARSCQKTTNWRKAVFTRDGFKCILCGSDKPRIHAHHIIPFSKSKKLRYDTENGVALCVECHQLFHPGITLTDYSKYFGGTYTGPYIQQMAGA